MLRKHAAHLALFLGLVLGVALSVYVPSADAIRNSSGNYSLPSGNPVVSGTTITSTNENAFRSDVASELTLSLDRNGRGAMLAPLQCSNGTVAAPSLTFGSDTDTGLYRIGANNPGLAVGGVLNQSWSSTGAIFARGLTVNQSQSNTAAFTATGNGTGHGVVGLGSGASAGAFTGIGVLGVGTTDTPGIAGIGGAGNSIGGSFLADGTGSGIYAVGGDSNGHGGLFLGDGTGKGLYATGGDSNGDGIYAVGGVTNGNGGVFDGTGTGAAVVAGAGGALFNGTNPSSSTGVSNRIYAASTVKAWGELTPSGAGTVTVSSGFNVLSVTCGNTGNDDYIVTLATGFSGVDKYMVLPSTSRASIVGHINTDKQSGTVFHIRAAGTCDTDTGTGLTSFVVFGIQ